MAVFRRKRQQVVPISEVKFSVSALYKVASDNNIKVMPLDIVTLIKALGIRLKIENMDDNVSGYLKRVAGSWVMGVNALHHIKRRRFTMAHELAHYCLHSSTIEVFEDTVLFRNGDANRIEFEANNFAAELLMPDEEFREFVKDTSANIDDLADNFNVSSMAVRVRAKVLGMQGHGL